MLTIGQEHFPPAEISTFPWELHSVTFSADSTHLFSGSRGEVGMWRIQDRQQFATMAADACCLAVSKDDERIAAGTWWGGVVVWDGKTHEQVFTHTQNTTDVYMIRGVDFSPDSTQLLVAWRDTVSVWDLSSHKQVQILCHGSSRVFAAKYSPQGDRIATGTRKSVQVWDSRNGCLLMKIKVKVTPRFNTGLLWLNNHLFVVSQTSIKQFDASTGSVVSEWPIRHSNGQSCIALPKHGQFIVYSTNHTVMLWDTSTHTTLGAFHHFQELCSVAISPDDRRLAIGEEEGNITIKNLPCVNASIVQINTLFTVNRINTHVRPPKVNKNKTRNLRFLQVTAVPTIHSTPCR